MITCAVVVPHPPLLVPELVPRGEAGEERGISAVRESTVAAVRALARVSGRWLAVGSGTRWSTLPPAARGTFRGFGVDVGVSLSATVTDSAAHPATELPLPALVAGWLRQRAGAESVRVELVPGDASVAECAEFGRSLANAEQSALLVLGDGSSRHTSAPSGWAHDAAEDFDAGVRRALAQADATALLGLDPGLAAELQAVGRAPWQVLAGLASATAGWRGELLYSNAPFGVAYHVAKWVRA